MADTSIIWLSTMMAFIGDFHFGFLQLNRQLIAVLSGLIHAGFKLRNPLPDLLELLLLDLGQIRNRHRH